jgi:acyl-CoA reductase-like NAD-dependent aldehyde dehydrogenase
MSEPERHENYIGGQWTPPRTGKYYGIRNPARPQQALGEFAASGISDVDAAVAAAAAARDGWAGMPGPQRGALLFRFAQLLEESKDDLGRIVTLEQGKTLGEATGEVGRAAIEARYMAGEASRPVGQTFPSERAGYACQTIREPVGVVATICPWNFPVVTPVRKIAPALAYGNTIIHKPASLTPWTSVYLMQLLERAGVPPGVVNLVCGAGAIVGDSLVSDSRVRGISFTGSSDIGTRIYETAARHLAGVQLELGGKNPAVVVDYEDLDGAAREIVSAAFLCSGQRCTALSRVIVGVKQADALVQCLLDRIGQIRVGDGMLETTTMGPLVSLAQLRTVDGYVRRGIASGCKLLCGGEALTADPESEGYFYSPTLFDDVAPDSPLAREEIFGPVLPVIRVPDAETAIRVANDTRYGLAAAVFTSRMNLAHEFARRLETGMVHINHGTASQAHVPFGGRKDSGQGAFSIGPTAQDFYTTVKTIYAREG